MPLASPVCSEGTIIRDLWLVRQLNVSYTDDELVRPGNASWIITNTMKNTTEQLTCPLRSNYVCEMNGTPQDPSLDIWLQINLDSASFTLNESLSCESTAGPGYETVSLSGHTSQRSQFSR
jgi:hypothetical protein